MLNAILAAGEEGTNPLIPAPYDIIWSAVCFVVILFFFWRLVLPRMKKLLDERSAAIEGNMEKADEAQREAEAALQQYTAQLAEARAEAAKIREQARVDAQRIGAEVTAQAQNEAERTKANAQVAIEADRQAALVSLRSEVGSLAIDLASGVVGESLSDDAKATALVDRFLADLEADTSGKK
ncbi:MULTISPECIES: F0F1 ATP synthase subunit B [Herbiconiux]|jgi:F-type H+-transporting ATPase subunit b|uniref:ATP synthase subunit b n=1 Tax=Herbiconiux flava TaxID=881268 RepID=A0A852SS88_9MICO|nr:MULTISPECIES: F0F1 ATP synthase subunit B [Herbiconiux]NQX33966.1 F0F1 ATP synthase subunit B [Herbiconiux sp. VKM Ac-2851]NYD71643.1 F-type H+-transporting ATPase subunit b [Herbiconiux flava]GLK18393.1 ATP synthase subunit b [Herbiconiux flava]